MLDPITALSVAATVIQFVDFGSKLLVKGREIHKSADGASVGNSELETIAKELQQLNHRLSQPLPSMENQDTALNDFEAALANLSKQCSSVAEELLCTLRNLKAVEGSPNRRWKSFRQALKCLWKKEKVEAMANRLQGFRERLNLHVLVSMRQTLDVQSINQAQGFCDLVKTLELQPAQLQQALADQQDRTNALIIAENKLTRETFTSYIQSSQKSQLLQMSSGTETQKLVESSNVLDCAAICRSRERVLNWLKPARPRDISLMEWEDGTCEWIFTHPTYKKWEATHYSSPLWIYGIPGCGKSVMANFLSQNTQTPLAFAHFFQPSANQGPTMMVSLAASLLAQVLEENSIRESPNFPQIVQHVVPLIDRFNSCDTCSFERLWSYLEYIFAILQNFTLLIDALDECPDSNHLFMLLKRLSALSNFSNSRVILISRYNGEYETHLPHSIHLSMDENTISPDIVHFIRKEIDRTPRLASQYQNIVSKVSADAQGMFLWAKLMIQYLKGAATPGLQRTRLDRFPIGLNAVYEQFIMEKGDLLEADELILRKEMFLLLTAAVRPLQASEISTALALKSTASPSHENMLIDPENEILRLCWPLVMIKDKHVQLIHFSVREFLFSHAKTTTKTNLRLRLKDSHRYMAQKCLNQLGQPSFASLETVASLLRRNVYLKADTNAPETPIPKVAILHEYACLYWHTHVVASALDENLVTQVSQFLRGKSFIAWAELLFHLKSGSDMAPVLAVRAELLSWHSLIPLNIRALIQMHMFFVGSYESTLKDLESSSTDRILPYLLLHRVGTYFNLAGEQPAGEQIDRCYQITRVVMEGTKTVLGARHPFTLRSTTEFAIEKLSNSEFDDSEALLWQVYEIQSEDLGVNAYDSFYTLSNYAYASYFQLKLEKSITLQESASAGLLRTLGSTNKIYVKSQLYLGRCLEAQGHLDCALAIYENIWKQWATLYSPDNTLAMMAQMALSTVHRKKRNFKEALEHGTMVFANRQRVFGEGNVITVDTALNLVILYLDSENYNDARAMLDLAISLGEGHQSFHILCLIERLKACLQMNTGDLETASKILKDLLHKASEDNLPNNRELLWARLSLADLLRSQGKNNEALQYFSDLVDPEAESEYSLDDFGELGALHQLAIAEISTRCIMNNDIKEAHRILKLNNLRWRSNKDYWIPPVAPFASI